jgi:2-aminoadipate transaminase
MHDLRTSQIAVAPDMIDFGLGQPGFDLLPAPLMQRAAMRRLDGNDNSFLNYGHEQGDGYFRRALAVFLSGQYAQAVDMDELFVTTGSSTALSLICTFFAEPGDVVFAEEPSYFLALRIFADHGLRVVGLPMDDAGVDLNAFEDALRKHRPKFFYTVPTFQNPTGITLSAPRRQALVDLAAKHDFLIVADEVYHSLGYRASPPAPMAAYTASNRVLSIGSFSKILAPGLRLGWIQTSPHRMQRFVSCGLVDSGGGLNPFTSALVRTALEEGWQNAFLAGLVQTYGARSARLDEALHAELDDLITFQLPPGGFFFWLRFVGPAAALDGDELLRAARMQRVGFQPGRRFSSQGGLNDRIRLSFAFYPTAALVEGAQRLGAVIRGAIAQST